MTLIHLPLASRVLWPDIGTRRGTIEATDGAWVIVRFARMVGTVRVPAEAVEGSVDPAPPRPASGPAMSRRQIVGIGVALIVGAVLIGFVPVSAETYATYRLLMAAFLGGTIGAGVVVVAIGLGKP